jgi:phosphopantetheine adenylyltransferase
VQAQQVLIRLYGHFAAIQQTSNNYARNLTILLPNSKNISLIEDITHLYTTDNELLNKYNKNRQESSLSSLICEKIDENQLQKLSKSLAETNLPTDYTPYEFTYKAFNCVSLAGTFDRIHFDHKILITLSSLVAKNKLVTAVLTVLGGKKHQDLIEDIKTRAERVKHFLDLIDTTITEKDLQIVTRCPNSDGCRLMNDPEIEAAVVENNDEGITGITRVNALRVEKFNLKALTVVWKHSCRIISSTDLREWIASQRAEKNTDVEH